LVLRVTECMKTYNIIHRDFAGLAIGCETTGNWVRGVDYGVKKP